MRKEEELQEEETNETEEPSRVSTAEVGDCPLGEDVLNREDGDGLGGLRWGDGQKAPEYGFLTDKSLRPVVRPVVLFFRYPPGPASAKNAACLFFGHKNKYCLPRSLKEPMPEMIWGGSWLPNPSM